MRKRAILSAPLTRYATTQAALAVSIALTAPVDSFLWGKPLWPVRWSSAKTCSALRRMTPSPDRSLKFCDSTCWTTGALNGAPPHSTGARSVFFVCQRMRADPFQSAGTSRQPCRARCSGRRRWRCLARLWSAGCGRSLSARWCTCCFTRRYRTRCAHSLAQMQTAVAGLTRCRCRKCAFCFRCCHSSTCVQRLHWRGSTPPGATVLCALVRLAMSHLGCAPRRKSPLRMLMFLAAVALVAASLAAKAVMTWAAYWNYPVRNLCSRDACLKLTRSVLAGWLGSAFAAPEQRRKRLHREQRAVQRARRRASRDERRVTVRGASGVCACKDGGPG